MDRDLRPGELEAAIERARRGEAAAIAYLYLRFVENVYGYVASIVRDEHEAQDIAQQVFTRMITAIRGYESRGVPFRAWLLRIAHNMALDHLRRQRAIPHEQPLVEVEPVDEPAGSRALSLLEALREVPEGQREVVVLRHVHGWSPPEIAAGLGRTENAVHALHHRGRRTLQLALARRDLTPAAHAA